MKDPKIDELMGQIWALADHRILESMARNKGLEGNEEILPGVVGYLNAVVGAQAGIFYTAIHRLCQGSGAVHRSELLDLLGGLADGVNAALREHPGLDIEVRLVDGRKDGKGES